MKINYELLESLCESDEERYFLWYLFDLHNAGYIENIERGVSLELIPKVISIVPKFGKYGQVLKSKTMIALGNKSYTPDYVVTWTHKALTDLLISDKLLHSPFYAAGEVKKTYFEIKPIHDGNGISKREFKTTQKIAYHTLGIYVELIIPQKIFEKTFTPSRYLFTDTGRQKRKINWEVKTLEQWLKN